MRDHQITVADGRTIGFIDYGQESDPAVLWCHGGPGSRFEPEFLARSAGAAGQRIVGIDRPGYGTSTPQPGRTIAGWVTDALAVADALAIEHFVTVGVSTGGAFALAVAAHVPERVLGVVACCALTDMRNEEARATMSPVHAHAVWDAPNRESALQAAVVAHGEQGSKLLDGSMADVLAPADVEMFGNPEWMQATMTGWPAMFTFGLEGYTDDRLADGGGWVGFDVARIRCPVVVLHGDSDRIVDVSHAHHTTAIVPTARLVVKEGLGHFSIEQEIIASVADIIGSSPRRTPTPRRTR